MLTTGMGGVLPEQPDPAIFRRVLDVGCGTGGWLIEAAKTYPSMTLLVGVDVSKRMVEYARSRAEAEQPSERVQFQTMDALRMLEFPSEFFDSINHRSVQGYLHTWDRPKLLQEYQRVARPGGMIRITEVNFALKSRSPTLEQRAGTPEGEHFYEDARLLYRTIMPFLQKWTRVPDDYQATYQQALDEMHQPDFVGRVGLLTAWGTTSVL